MASDLPSRSELLAALDREMRTVSAQSVLFSQAIADRVGLRSTDMECLDILNLTGPITAGRLAELTGLTTGAVTGVVDRLEQAGYVQRVKDPTDRRRVIVRLVPERAQIFGPYYASLSQAMDELYARYTDAELAVILDFTTRGNTAILREIARLRARAPRSSRQPTV